MNLEDDQQRPAWALSRRRLIQSSLAGSAAAVMFGGFAGERAAASGVDLAPLYYPLTDFVGPGLNGKLAVVTGASRGNGRAIAEALRTAGADVVGTSRNPAKVPNPPAFPLIALDVADAASVGTFPIRLAANSVVRSHRGVVDILANNAGRVVVGSMAPRPGTTLAFHTLQRDLAMRTLYSGHVMVTNVILPMLRTSEYARILFTVSVASYYTGSTVPGLGYLDAYGAGKAALRTYANNLGTTLALSGASHIQVTTVNPYAMHTALAQHPNPIYTQPVNAAGKSSDGDGLFDAVVTQFRDSLAGGLDPSKVGDTYAQLCQMTSPPPNVVVASPDPDLAAAGQNKFIEDQVRLENLTSSAMPFVAV